MLNAFKNFTADESGAVTVDWVVLTAALVGLGLAVMGVVAGGIKDVSTNISSGLSSTSVGCDTFSCITPSGGTDSDSDG